MQKTVMKKGIVLLLAIFLFAFIFFINQGSGAGGDPTAVPQVSITANPTSIFSGQSSLISWTSSSATAYGCYKSWGTGFTPEIGNDIVYPTSTTTYSILCINENGESSASATVTVPIPLTVSLTANPSSINSGESSTLSWVASARAAECIGTGFVTGGATSGSVSVSPTSTTTYSISCNDAVYNLVSDSAIIEVTPTTTTYSLTIDIANTGTVTGIKDTGGAAFTCSSPGCTQDIPKNGQVILSTTPTGGVFSGACSGTSSCSFAMTGPKDVTVTFPAGGAPQIAVAESSLDCGSVQAGSTGNCGSFRVTNIGTGILTGTASVSSPFSCGNDCNYELDPNGDYKDIPFTFSPTNATSYSRIVGFSGDGGTSRTITGTGTAPTTTKYTLTLTKSNTGTVTSNVGGISCGTGCTSQSALFDKGKIVNLFASGSFAQWGGACSGTDPTECTITMNSDQSVSATFSDTITQYPLTVGKIGTAASTGNIASIPGGIDCGSDCGENYSSGTVVSLYISGPGFSGWGGACSGTGSCTVTMDAAKTVTATFNANILTYSLTVNKAGTGASAGTISSNPTGIDCGNDCSENYNSGTSVSLFASGSGFSGWGGSCFGIPITAPCTVTMDANKSVTATFDASVLTYSLNISKAGTGTGTITGPGINCGSDCGEFYSSGTSVTLTAVPSSGSTFAGWSGGCSGTGTCTVTMTSAKTVTATFNLATTHTLNVSKSGTGSGTITGSGISCGSDCSEIYSDGASIILTASPAAGSNFTAWGGACFGIPITAPCTVTMNADKTVTASFGLSGGLPTCEITSASWSTSSVTDGTTVTMTAYGNTYCNGKDVTFSIKRAGNSIATYTNTFGSGTSVTKTWTAGPANAAPYYFIASITNPTSSQQSGDLLVTAAGGVDQCLDVSLCSDYTTSGTCNSDSCNVGDVSAPPNIDCSSPNTICGCSWNSTSSTCGSSWNIINQTTGNEVGSCTINQDTSDDCSDGFLSFSWTGIWTGNPAPEQATCEAGGTDTIPCPAQIQLPFISPLNVIAIIIIAILIYFILSKKEKKQGTKDKKKRR